MDEFFSNINVNILTDIIRRKIENSNYQSILASMRSIDLDS